MQPEADLPWVPLLSVYRSGLPEVTVYGIVYVWAEDRSLYANAGRALLRLGNTRTALWSRSLLKPWQFMVLYPTLKKAYPELGDEHFALMIASHQGDARQIQLLEELLELSGLLEDDLQCPPTRPLDPVNGTVANVLNHPCSGKHLGHLLYFKATGQGTSAYLDPQAEPYRLLRALLSYLLNTDVNPATTDSCGMPNYALSAVEAAQLYHALVVPIPRDLIQQAPEELEPILECWEDVAGIICRHPAIIGGENRLDTRLMQGTWQTQPDLPVIAKEGADGLLCVGIGQNSAFADGLGLYIKLSSGYQPAHLETVVFELLRRVGLKAAEPAPAAAGHLETRFHFELQGAPTGS